MIVQEKVIALLLAMHSLGHAFIPPPIHAGGLRYYGMAPLVRQTVDFHFQLHLLRAIIALVR